MDNIKKWRFNCVYKNIIATNNQNLQKLNAQIKKLQNKFIKHETDKKQLLRNRNTIQQLEHILK